MLYQILEKTPFSMQYYPSEPFRPIAIFQLQEAEYNLKLNKTHYYEHALMVGDRFGYPREIAERIAEYWRKQWSFAEYQLVPLEAHLTKHAPDRATCAHENWTSVDEQYYCYDCKSVIFAPPVM